MPEKSISSRTQLHRPDKLTGGTHVARRAQRFQQNHIKRSVRIVHSLQDVLVELLPAAQELPDHLSAQTLPLQDEAGDAHRSVRHEALLDQVLDPLLWFPAEQNDSS